MSEGILASPIEYPQIDIDYGLWIALLDTGSVEDTVGGFDGSHCYLWVLTLGYSLKSIDSDLAVLEVLEA